MCFLTATNKGSIFKNGENTMRGETGEGLKIALLVHQQECLLGDKLNPDSVLNYKSLRICLHRVPSWINPQSFVRNQISD